MELINLSKISSEEILAGSFGIEWESLRVKSNGELALTPHPSVFGDKLKNPVVTTDFSEKCIGWDENWNYDELQWCTFPGKRL